MSRTRPVGRCAWRRDFSTPLAALADWSYNPLTSTWKGVS